MKSEKYVKLSAIEAMAMPMKAIHEKMGDEEYEESEEYECPKCGHKWSENESEEESEDYEEDEEY